VRIIGNGIRGGNSGLPLETELGGISSITNTGNTLVLADPNNEQLLFWNSSSGTLSAITTRTTGIITPTSVQFFGNSLLIGAKNGLFKMNDSSKTGNTLDTITVN
jgi:hypothetical protein